MKIGVTGAAGFLGFHVRACAHENPDLEVVCADRDTFSSDDKLAAFVDGCDGIIHLAGMNRGDEQEVAETNVALTRNLVTALESTGSKAAVAFSSSTQIEMDNPYGKSKLECAGLLDAWANSSGGRFTDVVLPGVFGEGGRPFYNSVVSTFCTQLAAGEELTVHGDSPLELVHAQGAARALLDAVTGDASGRIRVEGVKTSVVELAETLRHLASSYSGNVIPDIRDDYIRDLFNTYRSYIFPEQCPIPLVRHDDDRGHFTEAVRSLGIGQFSYSVTKPGITRGHHYHYHKVERFVVVGGEGVLRLRRLFSDTVHEFPVNGKAPVCVDIPTFHAHSIENTGDTEMITLFWVHELYDPANPDTIMEDVH